MASICKKWLANISQALHLNSDGTLDRYQAISAFLLASMIVLGNHSQLFLNVDEVVFPCQVVWLIGCLAMLNKLVITSERKQFWQEAKPEYIAPWPMIYMAPEKAGLKNAGFRFSMANSTLLCFLDL